VPSGQREKFTFPSPPPPPAEYDADDDARDDALTPSRHTSKALAEKRREIEALKAEINARRTTDSAGEAAEMARAAFAAARLRRVPCHTGSHTTPSAW
jgi:hypothetical protein